MTPLGPREAGIHAGLVFTISMIFLLWGPAQGLRILRNISSENFLPRDRKALYQTCRMHNDELTWKCLLGIKRKENVSFRASMKMGQPLLDVVRSACENDEYPIPKSCHYFDAEKK